jgi:molecular chaperone DnaJ
MDYYQILAVERTATEEQIKKAYRKLAMKYHPDRNPGDENAVEQFKKVQEAYETLSDASKKTQYDRFGSTGHRPYAPPPPKREPEKPKTKEDFERDRAEQKRKERAAAGVPGVFTQADLDRIQCTFFGGGNQGRSIMTQLKLTPAEMKKGGSKTVQIKRRTMCPTCVGDGTAMKMCPRCKGDRPDVGWCPICDGQGATPDKCPTCNGEGVKPWTIVDVRVVWSPNVQPGHQVNILGEGEMAPRKLPGNLRVVLVQ